MKLKEYLRPMSEQERLDFAQACDTSLQYLKFVAYGAKKASPVLAMSIEKESDGAVPVEETRPDLIEQWAYLRGTSPQDASRLMLPAPIVEDRRVKDQRAGDRRVPDLFTALPKDEAAV